jgi:hypothetical protein
VMGRGSSFSINSRLWAGRPGLDFSLHHRVKIGSESHPASHQMDTGVLSGGGGVKRPGRRFNAEDNAWNCTSTSPYVFMAWCLIKKNRDHLYWDSDIL